MKGYYFRSLKADMDIESIVEMSLTMTKTNMIIGMSIIWSFQEEKYSILWWKNFILINSCLSEFPDMMPID